MSPTSQCRQVSFSRNEVLAEKKSELCHFWIFQVLIRVQDYLKDEAHIPTSIQHVKQENEIATYVPIFGILWKYEIEIGRPIQLGKFQSQNLIPRSTL